MVITSKFRVIVCCIFSLMTFITVTNSVAESNFEKYSLSLPQFSIENNERITGFKITIQNGYVSSVTKIPPGWYFNIDIPLQNQTNVTAGSVIGVAEFTKNDTGYFNDFLVVSVLKSEEHNFNVDVEVSVVNDSSKQRKIRLNGNKKVRWRVVK